LAELLFGDLALLLLLARIQLRLGAKKTADMVGTKRRSRAL
jgi:hypothetical protein